jgi:cytochrome c
MYVSPRRALSAALFGGLGFGFVACSAPPAAALTAPPPIALATAPAKPPEPPKPADPAKPAPPTVSPALVQQGQQLVAAKGCGGCHVVPGVPGAIGTIGPNLGGVATRPTIAGGAVPNNGPDDLEKWILDPPALKPGSQMPKLGLTTDEAQAIAAFLETLR